MLPTNTPACGSIIQRESSPLRLGLVLFRKRMTKVLLTSIQPLGWLPQFGRESGVVVDLEVVVTVPRIAERLPDVGNDTLKQMQSPEGVATKEASGAPKITSAQLGRVGRHRDGHFRLVEVGHVVDLSLIHISEPTRLGMI